MSFRFRYGVEVILLAVSEASQHIYITDSKF